MLTTGRVIDADEAWFEGKELRYRQKGTVYAVPRALVARIGAAADGTPFEDPDTRRSRESLAKGDAPEALRFARLALFRDASSVPAL